MSKMKIKICKECQRHFKTRANYLSTCDYCITDGMIAREKDNPNSNYNHLIGIWKTLEKQWLKKKKSARKLAMKKLWSDLITTNQAFNWTSYQRLNYYLGVSVSVQLTKKEFDSIKKEQLAQ